MLHTGPDKDMESISIIDCADMDVRDGSGDKESHSVVEQIDLDKITDRSINDIPKVYCKWNWH